MQKAIINNSIHKEFEALQKIKKKKKKKKNHKRKSKHEEE